MENAQEFIGSHVEITDPEKRKTKGIIIEETKSTFKVKTEKKTKTILKRNHTFIIENKKIEGNKIIKRPEERIKK